MVNPRRQQNNVYTVLMRKKSMNLKDCTQPYQLDLVWLLITMAKTIIRIYNLEFKKYEGRQSSTGMVASGLKLTVHGGC